MIRYGAESGTDHDEKERESIKEYWDENVTMDRRNMTL